MHGKFDCDGTFFELDRDCGGTFALHITMAKREHTNYSWLFEDEQYEDMINAMREEATKAKLKQDRKARRCNWFWSMFDDDEDEEQMNEEDRAAAEQVAANAGYKQALELQQKQQGGSHDHSQCGHDHSHDKDQ